MGIGRRSDEQTDKQSDGNQHVPGRLIQRHKRLDNFVHSTEPEDFKMALSTNARMQRAQTRFTHYILFLLSQSVSRLVG